MHSHMFHEAKFVAVPFPAIVATERSGAAMRQNMHSFGMTTLEPFPAVLYPALVHHPAVGQDVIRHTAFPCKTLSTKVAYELDFPLMNIPLMSRQRIFAQKFLLALIA